MFRTFAVVLFCLLFIVGCFLSIEKDGSTVRIIITFDWEEDLVKTRESIMSLDGFKYLSSLDLINGIVAEVPRFLIPFIEKNFDVRYVEEDTIVYALDAPPPPVLIPCSQALEVANESTRQWNMNAINAYEAHEINQAQEVRVGVIDTGISSAHPDLLGAVKGGYNAIGIGWGSWEDDNGHGTAVAGIIGARKNGYGIIGVAPKCWLYAIKVLSSKGSGYSSDVVKGYQWALDQDISLVNLSLGSWSKSQAMADAMIRAGYQGMGTICATGNDGRDQIIYPARNIPAVCVGAVGTDLKRAPWSNFGPEMKTTGIVAPGAYVLTLNYKGGHRRVSGTSIATPHVTGVVALMKGMRYALRRFMFETSSRSDDPDIYTGYGLVDAKGTLEALIAASE